jgi:hypothetical protein
MFNQSFFSCLILICLIISPSTAQLSYFKNCENNEYPINLTTLNFNPNPIEIGKNLVTNVSGTSMKSIQSGSIMTANFSYNGKLVDSLKFDLCRDFIKASGKNCPLEPGEFNITANSTPSVGPNYPKNTTYKFNTIFTGNELTLRMLLLYNYNLINYLLKSIFNQLMIPINQDYCVSKDL